jgi:hypothetical protein
MSDEPEIKDCAFQFIKNGKVIEDTGLITRSDADDMWLKHKPAFIKCVENGDSAEVALWVDMGYSTNYRKTAFDFSTDDCIMENDRCYVKNPLP